VLRGLFKLDQREAGRARPATALVVQVSTGSTSGRLVVRFVGVQGLDKLDQRRVWWCGSRQARPAMGLVVWVSTGSTGEGSVVRFVVVELVETRTPASPSMFHVKHHAGHRVPQTIAADGHGTIDP
jgi:hypothetical protein